MKIPEHEYKKYLEDVRKISEKNNVRECKLCTSLIADSLTYGRKASFGDSDICEICWDLKDLGEKFDYKNADFYAEDGFPFFVLDDGRIFDGDSWYPNVYEFFSNMATHGIEIYLETNKAIDLYKDWMGNLEPILNGQFPFQDSKLKDVYANKLVIKWESNGECE